MDIETLLKIREEINYRLLTMNSPKLCEFTRGFKRSRDMINGMIKKERNKLKINNK